MAVAILYVSILGSISIARYWPPILLPPSHWLNLIIESMQKSFWSQCQVMMVLSRNITHDSIFRWRLCPAFDPTWRPAFDSILSTWRDMCITLCVNHQRVCECAPFWNHQHITQLVHHERGIQPFPSGGYYG